jgi:methylenetetrahydrofolate--tRNA-(uracil-5-)-methyltransferase
MAHALAHTAVIGGGLAGCEAAWQLACRGITVDLYEMRPAVRTPAHQTDLLAELVCSNSLKSDADDTASGLLKRELRALDSLILRVADQTAVPAGSALAVDREAFAARVTGILAGHTAIRLIREEVTDLSLSSPLVLASGPLTSPALSEAVAGLLGQENLYFYDAIAPLVEAGSLDREKIYQGSRYGKGPPSYLNCPLSKPEYDRFLRRLLEAETAPLRSFEKGLFFESCLPIEELARRGPQTLLFGPMRPVGLRDPRTGKRPYAVIQLRQDNAAATVYNMVGCQTRLRHGEQKALFRMIPGLEKAVFLRYGSVHRNTYICAPRILTPALQVAGRETFFMAGQITGAEGYLESTATGLMAGINLARALSGKMTLTPPETTALGSLCRYITAADAADFQPMNINFGLLPQLASPPRNRKLRNRQLVHRAVEDLNSWIQEEGVRHHGDRRASAEEISCLPGAGEKLL